MEPLSDPDVLARIEKPKNKAALQRGQLDNDRQRFHALLATGADDAGPYAERLLSHVNEILTDEDKQKKFKTLMRFPVPTARIVDSAADEYHKIFTADDRLIEVECSSDTQTTYFREFIDEELKLEEWIRKAVFNQNLRSSNSIWYADLPAEINATGYPQPVLQLRTFGQLHDIDTDRKGRISLLIIPMAPLLDSEGEKIADRWAVLDSASYRIAVKNVNSDKPVITLTNPHPVGICPAGFICHHRLDDNNPIRRESPLHAVFDELDQLVIGKVFSRHADLYASFPILWQYKTKCDYHEPTGEVCYGGYVTIQTENGEKRKRCPKCEKRKPLGPGSVFKVPPPTSREESDNREPLGFVNADPTLLEYNLNKLAALEKSLKEALTGESGDAEGNTAQNEDQIKYRAEAQKAILQYWAENTETTHGEILDVLGRLMFADGFLSRIVSYGREFRLLSLGEAEMLYTEALKNGLPSYLLSKKREIVTRLLSGPSAQEQLRMQVLSHLEPYVDVSIGMIDKTTEEYELKANFSNYIARFEREWAPVEQVAAGGSMRQRIDFILPKLYDYVKATIAKRPKPEQLAGPGGRPKPATV